MGERADRGQEPPLRIFRVDSRLEGMSVDRKLVLPLRKWLSGGDAQLPFDEIEAGDHLGHRMLDLEAGVHLHEVERPVARERVGGDELDGSRADIADCARGGNRRLAHRAAMLRLHPRRRRFLEHLLVTALHRAVALEQIHDIALRVREHLDLDVTRRRQVSFDQHARIGE